MKKIGVITDTHGKDTTKAAEVFLEEDVDFILALGDYGHHRSNDYALDIDSAIRGLASTGNDVLVIPGNH